MADPWDKDPVVRSAAAPVQAARANPWDADPVVGGNAPSRQARAVAPLEGDPVALISQASGARISSGYRDPERNRSAGGVANSYHTRGQALDLVPQPGETMAQVEARLRASGLPLRELINEGDHVHVAWDGAALTPDMTADYFTAGQQAQPAAVEPMAETPSVTPLPVAAETAPSALGSSPDAPIDLANLRYADEVAALRKGAWVKNGEEVYQLPGDAFSDQTRPSDEAVAGNLYVRRPNMEDTVGAFATAASEQIPFLDESAAFTAGLASGEGYDAARESQRVNRELLNQTNRTARNVGGVAGFATGFLAPGAGFIGRGANAGQMAGRATLVGGIGGGAYGAGAADDSYASRLSGLGQGAVIGAATGGLFQMGANRLTQNAARSITAPASQARRLSRAGVDLTPGQMVSEVPLVGPALRSLEEGASSIPVAGSAISGARQRGIEGFNRVTINSALEPIGVSVPENVQAGYPAVEFAQQALSRAYDDVLRDVQIVPDRDLYDGLANSITDAVESSGAPGARRISREIQDRVFRYLGNNANAPIDGQQFKALESEFTTLAGNALNAQDGATRAVGRAYQAVNDTLRDALERQNPGRRDALRRVNDAYARMVRVETASGSSASQAAEGVFSPTQLGAAVGSQSGRRASARGDALMQDLVGPARGVLNSRIGDSGTATRGAVTALASGAAGTAAVLNPAVAVPVIVGVSAAYSRPAQRALNALYRATDNPGAAQRHLARLASLARREPALQPYYQEAVRFVSGQEPLRPQSRDAQNQTPEQRLAG